MYRYFKILHGIYCCLSKILLFVLFFTLSLSFILIDFYKTGIDQNLGIAFVIVYCTRVCSISRILIVFVYLVYLPHTSVLILSAEKKSRYKLSWNFILHIVNLLRTDRIQCYTLTRKVSNNQYFSRHCLYWHRVHAILLTILR